MSDKFYEKNISISKQSLFLSENFLRKTMPHYSCYNINYKVVIIIFMCFIALIFDSEAFCIFNFTIYILHNIFKSYIFFVAAKSEEHKYKDDDAYDYPIYTIAIPMYKEIGAVASVVRSIQNLDYPKDRLDVQIIIEEDDIFLHREIILSNLPKYFRVISVPKSTITTKPKALNYAINYAIGKYIVVYDSEDIPEPKQLKKACFYFSKLGEKYVCIQAKLKFYNYCENLLSWFINLEYIIWFGYLIKGISKLDMPIPLGGSSNHFSVKHLKEIGMWDPHNLTEDADLGLRIYCNNYKTYLMDSYTYEEAPVMLYQWIKQRSRWIKGFIQTFMVYTKLNFSRKVKLNFKFNLILFLFIGSSFYVFFLQGVFFYYLIKKNSSTIYILWALIKLYGAICIYSFGFISLKNNNIMGIKEYLKLAIAPLYFILHFIATYLAIIELFFRPFAWNKTQHGLTKYKFTFSKGKEKYDSIAELDNK